MKKFIQIAAIILMTFLFSNVYTYAASDNSPLIAYKHPLISGMNQVEGLIEDLHVAVSQEKEKETERKKEQKKQEITKLVKKKKLAVIEEVKTHRLALEKQLDLFEDHSSMEKMKAYETEKSLEIEVQLEEQIADYLTDLLIEKH